MASAGKVFGFIATHALYGIGIGFVDTHLGRRAPDARVLAVDAGQALGRGGQRVALKRFEADGLLGLLLTRATCRPESVLKSNKSRQQ